MTVMRATEPTNSIDEGNGDRLQSATNPTGGQVSDAREEEKIEKPSGEITWYPTGDEQQRLQSAMSCSTGEGATANCFQFLIVKRAFWKNRKNNGDSSVFGF
ncbi:hypothetical protein WN944_013981 [Citrus x changshan-huyou]|uniref:Uncharacterized protein n=1 Tax=Citrus x changshan-huyou TaxID=2935761 RepID=A0AAP0MBC1_9ROSI